ncbi:MAG TPA: hypothetical protein VLT36_25230 [Candidatus Dormibacteraeota bacterium]|nr:hypothetical protein [Candidatus Dormibacteraeota bacterium]
MTGAAAVLMAKAVRDQIDLAAIGLEATNSGVGTGAARIAAVPLAVRDRVAGPAANGAAVQDLIATNNVNVVLLLCRCLTLP